MIDRNVVARKLMSLRAQVALLRERRPAEVSAFLGDGMLRDATAMALLVAAQDAIDLAAHVCTDEGWGIPASYAEAFQVLASRGVLPPDLAAQLAGIAALRNRLAHGYASVDVSRLWTELPAGADALERFAAAIARLASSTEP